MWASLAGGPVQGEAGLCGGPEEDENKARVRQAQEGPEGHGGF